MVPALNIGMTWRRFVRAPYITVVFLTWTGCGGDPVPDSHVRAQSSAAVHLPLMWTTTSVVMQDSLLQRAAAAIADGRPSLASRILATRLSDSAQRTPEVVLLAAEAAAAWDGWREVEHLLNGAEWLDATAEGRGRELLARAYLSYSPRTTAQDSAAAHHAARAISSATDNRTMGVRRVLLARALDRLQQLDRAVVRVVTEVERAAALLDRAR